MAIDATYPTEITVTFTVDSHVYSLRDAVNTVDMVVMGEVQLKDCKGIDITSVRVSRDQGSTIG